MEGALKSVLVLAVCFLMVRGTLVIPWKGPAGLARGRQFQYAMTPYPAGEAVSKDRPRNGLQSNLTPMEGQPHGQVLINSDSLGCAVEEVFRQALPEDPSHAEYVKLLAYTWSVEECLDLCCSLRASECQYVWLFGYRCLSVSCVMSRHCQPRHIADAETSISSVYIKISHTENMYPTSNTLVSHLDSGEDKSHDFGEKSHDKSHDYVYSDGQSDSPPIARVYSPVIVDLPTDEVCLDGTGSTDDKGIVEYRWRLVSGVQKGKDVQLVGTESSIVCVSNLVGGVYLFELTVADSLGQTSQTGVIVDVLAGNPASSSATSTSVNPTPLVQSSQSRIPTPNPKGMGTMPSHGQDWTPHTQPGILTPVSQAIVLPTLTSAPTRVRTPTPVMVRTQAIQVTMTTLSDHEARHASFGTIPLPTTETGQTGQSPSSTESTSAKVAMATSNPQLQEQAVPHSEVENEVRVILLWRLIFPLLAILGFITAVSVTIFCISCIVRRKVLRTVDHEYKLVAYTKILQSTD